MARKKIPRVERISITAITAKERKEVHRRIKKRQDQVRKKYPELHGEVVDFNTHGVEDGTLYVSVRFKDRTHFSIRYASEMLCGDHRLHVLANRVHIPCLPIAKVHSHKTFRNHSASRARQPIVNRRSY
jgi:hypothetical protein